MINETHETYYEINMLVISISLVQKGGEKIYAVLNEKKFDALRFQLLTLHVDGSNRCCMFVELQATSK